MSDGVLNRLNLSAGHCVDSQSSDDILVIAAEHDTMDNSDREQVLRIAYYNVVRYLPR